MKLLRLFLAVISLSLRQEIAFRLDFLFSLLLTAAGVASGIAALAIVYAHTATLGGWPRGEAIVLLGTFQLITVLLDTFITPNLRWFGSQVKNGSLDEVLLKPVSSLVYSTLGNCRPLAFVNVVLALATVAVGLRDLQLVPSPIAILGWVPARRRRCHHLGRARPRRLRHSLVPLRRPRRHLQQPLAVRSLPRLHLPRPHSLRAHLPRPRRLHLHRPRPHPHPRPRPRHSPLRPPRFRRLRPHRPHHLERRPQTLHQRH